MPGNKSTKKEGQSNKTELRGKVIVKKFGVGSKSEHDAVCLVSALGTFVLRRAGGNPFHDEKLHALVGKEIISHGSIKKPYFMMVDFEEKK